MESKAVWLAIVVSLFICFCFLFLCEEKRYWSFGFIDFWIFFFSPTSKGWNIPRSSIAVSFLNFLSLYLYVVVFCERGVLR